MAERKTKTMQIKKYLMEQGSITSWVAWELFNTTRLSSIIYNLRRGGMNIQTNTIVRKDCNGNTCQFAEYKYVSES